MIVSMLVTSPPWTVILTVVPLDHNDVNCTTESGWVDGVPGLGNGSNSSPNVLHRVVVW